MSELNLRHMTIYGNSRRPDATFWHNGQIVVGARVARLLDLEAGDVLGLACVDGEWLLYTRLKAGERVGRHEGVLHVTNKGSRPVACSSVRMARAVLDAAGQAEVCRLACGELVEVSGLGRCVPLIVRKNLER